MQLAGAYASGTVTGGRERPTILAVVSAETLIDRAAARGVVVGDEMTISGESARRLACDAGIHRAITEGRSVTLDLGAVTRTVSDRQHLALVERDGGCRWPGCERPLGWCEAHHIEEVWRDDGPTDLHNLALFCSEHHHLLHDRRWGRLRRCHDLEITTPAGAVLAAPPRGPVLAEQWRWAS